MHARSRGSRPLHLRQWETSTHYHNKVYIIFLVSLYTQSRLACSQHCWSDSSVLVSLDNKQPHNHRHLVQWLCADVLHTCNARNDPYFPLMLHITMCNTQSVHTSFKHVIPAVSFMKKCTIKARCGRGLHLESKRFTGISREKLSVSILAWFKLDESHIGRLFMSASVHIWVIAQVCLADFLT